MLVHGKDSTGASEVATVLDTISDAALGSLGEMCIRKGQLSTSEKLSHPTGIPVTPKSLPFEPFNE
jgi:hypothetical protein